MDLQIDSLSCRRAGRQVLHRIDFTLPAGSAAALRGPNGAGKSTLLRALAGLLPISGGDVRLHGQSLVQDRGSFQEQIAYAGHLDAVKPALGVLENLKAWALLNGQGAARAEAALERFGLTPIASRPAVECSAGQRRRLGLARLLVADRALWLMDEPTVSLDKDAKGLIADLVREHVAAGGMALIATHEDLGLGSVPALEIQPASAADRAADTDPFLAGAW